MSLTARFWRYVPDRPVDDCWEWHGTRYGLGYGVLGRGGRGEGNVAAHRLSWEIHNGPIPEGMCVLHACDNPPCVNPMHLWLGTRDDNNKDMTRKRRHAAHLGTRRHQTGDDHWMRRHPELRPRRVGKCWIPREAA